MIHAGHREMRAPQRRGSFRMLGVFVRTYPGRATNALVAVTTASLLSGLGMSMLLTMLALGSNSPGAKPSGPQRLATYVVESIGVSPTRLHMLLVAAALIGLSGVMSLVANRHVGYTVARIATDLRLQLVRATMGARWQHYLEQSVGGLSNAIATEAQRASETFQLGAEMAATVITSVVYLIVAFAISVEAGVAATIAGGVLLLAFRALIKSSRRAGQRQTILQKSLLTLISAQFASAKPLKAMAREDHVDALLTDETKQLELALRDQVISNETLTALQEPILAIMAGMGFYLAGTMLHMEMADQVMLLVMLVRVVGYLSKGQKAYQQVVVRESAYWALVHAIDLAHAQRESPGGGRIVRLTRGIDFENLTYAHGAARPVLRDVSLHVPARGLTLIVGPSGSGKTTLLDLVIGLREPDRGRILIDGVPLPDLELRDWRRQIGYVPQESVMVDESVALNLTLGEDISEARIRAALRAADALQFVEAMPEGIRTRVGEGGSRLSGGQRQRLAIARALIHEPRLLILDEATSNLDPDAQEAIVETVAHLKSQLAVMAVAHQEKMVRIADQMLRLADGRIEPLSQVEARAALGG
ncbi:MAG TPA: ABC transporter ATP-binding protein [Steroidobacteraceae bacterium]|nr:ABC transporter ATP-binding protein [Steroidobacteraceae bacterium]